MRHQPTSSDVFIAFQHEKQEGKWTQEWRFCHDYSVDTVQGYSIIGSVLCDTTSIYLSLFEITGNITLTKRFAVNQGKRSLWENVHQIRHLSEKSWCGTYHRLPFRIPSKLEMLKVFIFLYRNLVSIMNWFSYSPKLRCILVSLEHLYSACIIQQTVNKRQVSVHSFLWSVISPTGDAD